MKKLLFSAFVLSCASIFTSCNNHENSEDLGTDMGGLHISKSKPQRGDKLQIRYNKNQDSSAASTAEPTQGYVYYIVNENMYPRDIDLKDSANLYLATIVVPDSVTALAFNFNQDGTNDTNDQKGFVLPVYNKDGQEVAGSKSSIANFYQDNGDDMGISMENDSLISYYEADFKAHPELKSGYFGPQYAGVLNSKDKAAAKKFTDAQIAELQKKDSLTEEDYTSLSRFYASGNNREMQDSISNTLAKIYPNSKAAQAGMYTKFRNEKNLDKKEELVSNFKVNGIYRDYMLQSLASSYAEKGDFEKFEKYASQTSDAYIKASTYNQVAYKLAENDKNLDKAAEISKKSLDILKDQYKGENTPKSSSKSQYKKSLDYSSSSYLDTYAFILFKQGKTKEAVQSQEKAVAKNDENPVINDNYLKYLIASGDYEKAQNKAEDFIRMNKGSKATKVYFKKAYSKNQGSNKGYDEYLDKLETKAHANAIAKLKKEMISEEAPKFSLMDLDGNEVSLASLKGKTVVVDFWATWCGPCKSSFPGMQMAVEKFKDSSDVKFLFVDTWEHMAPDARKKEVQKFITEHKYDFHVLLDKPVEKGSSDYATVSEYGIRGIPTKFVIGPNGKIRFKAVGYNGNTEKLAEEIEMMISLAKS